MSAASVEPVTTRAGVPEYPVQHSLDVLGGCLTMSRAVLLLYGEEHVNLALADELALDGYEVRRASDPAKLRAACDAYEVDLVIFGRATRRGAWLDVLRQLRAGAFAPEVKPGLRTLWIHRIRRQEKGLPPSRARRGAVGAFRVGAGDTERGTDGA